MAGLDKMKSQILSEAKAAADEKTAKVVVPDYQLSLAIGKEGQNARLAARLTGYKIDIKSETQAKDAEGFRYEDYMFDEDGDVYYEEEYEEDADEETQEEIEADSEELAEADSKDLAEADPEELAEADSEELTEAESEEIMEAAEE